MWLAKAFGRVPMLATGETYINTPAKARAKDFAEMWDFIIDDLKAAVDELGWDPMDGQYGRITKGFALSYLGEAYMWKAYRVPAEADANYTLAAAALLQVIQSGKYELNPSFTTLWDPGAVWTKECIWEEVLDEGSQWDQSVQSIPGSQLDDPFCSPSVYRWMGYLVPLMGMVEYHMNQEINVVKLLQLPALSKISTLRGNLPQTMGTILICSRAIQLAIH